LHRLLRPALAGCAEHFVCVRGRFFVDLGWWRSLQLVEPRQPAKSFIVEDVQSIDRFCEPAPFTAQEITARRVGAAEQTHRRPHPLPQ
jgi:hypothetical protein